MSTINFQLSNGLRIILDTEASDNVVYAGIAVAAGTRYELPHESGMAHLVEHMTFKGTRHLTSIQILNRMESVGGDLNAYTGKEEVVYYATFPRQHLHRALTLLTDIVFDSTYPQVELEKEREVVIDEIESYNDSPAELIYDDFEALLYKEQPLGRSILGDADSLRHYTADDLLAFTRRLYKPERAVLFVKGKVTEKEIRKNLASLTSSMRGGEQGHRQTGGSEEINESCLLRYTPVESIVPKDTHQAHVMLGAPAYALTDSRYMGLALLNNILGGPAMNSRLSLALRERTGLVYTVESSLSAYTDTSTWAVYFGCDHDDVRRCLRLVKRELHRLTDSLLSSRTLEAVKRQLCGQMSVATDNFENTALGMAKRFLLTDYVPTLEKQMARINALQASELQAIAQEIFASDRLTTLIYN